MDGGRRAHLLTSALFGFVLLSKVLRRYGETLLDVDVFIGFVEISLSRVAR